MGTARSTKTLVVCQAALFFHLVSLLNKFPTLGKYNEVANKLREVIKVLLLDQKTMSSTTSNIFSCLHELPIEIQCII